MLCLKLSGLLDGELMKELLIVKQNDVSVVPKITLVCGSLVLWLF